MDKMYDRVAIMKQFCYCEYVSIRHNSKEYNSIYLSEYR